MGKHKQLTVHKKLIATILAGGLLATGVGTAFAGGGDGSEDADGGETVSTTIIWAYKDDASGAWGSANDEQSVYRAFNRAGVGLEDLAGQKIASALTQARNNCEEGFRQRHPNDGAADCRVVAVGAATYAQTHKYDGHIWHPANTFEDAWNKTVAPNKYSYAGMREYRTSNPFDDDPSMSVDGLMRNALSRVEQPSLVVIALDKYQPAPPEVPPAPPTKTVEKGVSADSMTNRTVIETGTGVGGKRLRITDTITPNGLVYRVDNLRLVDTTTGSDVQGAQLVWHQQDNTVNASYDGALPDKHTWRFSFDVTVSQPTDYKAVQDTGTVQWNHNPAVSTNPGEFPTWQPNPDKSWVRWDSKTKQWQTVIDPDHTNATGADRMVFLDGDKVGAVVNGTLPARLAQAPERIVLTDNYANADYLWDPAESKDMRVFEISADTDRHSSVADIINKGRDVTGQWTVSIDKNTHTITAASSKQYAQAQQNLPQPKQLTVLAPGVVNFANGKGAAQVRADFGKNPSDELTFCANPGNNPTDTTLTNAGAQTVNNHTVATNEPYICGYVPPVVKDVLAEASQGGDQESVDGKTVYPGQKVEYRLETHPTLPANLGYTVEQVQIRDTFSPYLTPDKQTVEVTDLASGKIISKKQYQTRWDSKAHQFTLTFGKKYVADNWGSGATPRLLVRFEGTVSKDAPANKTVDNRWELVLNNSITVSNMVSNTPPTPEPHKADKSVKNRSVSIDGKTLLVGEQGVYQLTLDATDKNTAYKVYRLGMVDDFDERYVSILAHDVTVVSDTGRDVTDLFNIQVRDGAVYVFAKTVDTEIPATGETVLGDPQPDNLAESCRGHRLRPWSVFNTSRASFV